MKRLTLLFACALFFGVTATFAQDTTRTKREGQKQDQTRQHDRNKQSDQYKKNETDEMKGYTKVEITEIPQGLRSTLSSGTQYKGWDNASSGAGVYKNASGDYVVRIQNGSEKKVYHFDKDGNPVPQPRDH